MKKAVQITISVISPASLQSISTYFKIIFTKKQENEKKRKKTAICWGGSKDPQQLGHLLIE